MKLLNTVLAASIALAAYGAPETDIWYSQPAQEWMEACPIGNGRLSGMVYGGIGRDRIALNEISMWSGQHDPTSNDLCGADRLAEMRTAFFEGNYEKGDSLGQTCLNGRMTSFGTHLPVGDLVIETPTRGRISDYKRTLDLARGVVDVTYKDGNVSYTREYVASHPAQVMAVRVTSSAPRSVDFSISLDLLRDAKITAAGDELGFAGKVDFPMHGPGGVNFQGGIRVIPEGGTVSASDGKVTVKNADAATILIDIRTDYVNSDYASLCSSTLDGAQSTGWDNLIGAHLADYKALFSRMAIDLGDSQNSDLATDTRLRLAKSGVVDPGLDALFFQYGRYMLIASSRSNGMPLCANLQGIWNDNGACNMPWTCDYHLDINIAQNYWSANRANLAECNEPLFRYLELLVDNGRDTARKMYGCDGWVAHTVANAWGYTAPGWGVSWGMNVTGGAWLATHAWSHYLYTRDDEYLRTVGYPILKETALFFKDYMVEDPNTGHLLTGPSISPENGYVSPSGNHLSLALMPTIDREIAYDIYTACIESSKILGVDKKLRRELERDIKRLPPIEIGADGQIKEWHADVNRADPSHRHSSHLLGLFPLNQISKVKTPELADAARLSLEKQTSDPNWEDTEWSTANMMCFFARLRDGEKAHGWLQNLFRRFTRENLMTVSPAGVAMAEFDIFSFDATEASVAGICEMLVQNQNGYVDFLPALPEAWKNGSVSGLCLEGGLTVDMDWQEGVMSAASLEASRDCIVAIGSDSAPVEIKKGKRYGVTFDAEGNFASVKELNGSRASL